MSTQQQPPPRVTVGVDGRPDTLAALRYGCREATSLGATLELVHVVPDFLPVSPRSPESPVDLAAIGASLLADATKRVAALAPDLVVETRLRHGFRAAQIATTARGAVEVVLGRDDRPVLQRLLRSDTVTAVAARASAPVVEVPSGWRSDAHGIVVVGVKSRRHAPELLDEAFTVARRRHATLVVLHAWQLPNAYDDIIEIRVDLESWRRHAATQTEDLLTEWRAAYPEVPVHVEVVHGHAAQALVAASRSADLVVIVRREHGVPAALHLGGVARTVLRASECPVWVAPPVDEPPTPPVVLERDGELVR